MGGVIPGQMGLVYIRNVAKEARESELVNSVPPCLLQFLSPDSYFDFAL